MCILISNLKFYEFYIKIVFFLTNFQFPIAAIPSVLTLLVTAGVSTKVYLVQKAYAKGQLISKANCRAMNFSKKQKNEFVFTTMRRVFVRFLEEIV